MADVGDRNTMDLHELIRKVRGRVRGLLRWNGVLMATAAGMTYLLVAMWLAHLLPQILHASIGFWVGLVLVPSGTYWFFGPRLMGRYETDEQIAMLVQREVPECEDAPINCIQLEQERYGGRSVSTDMVNAYLRGASKDWGPIAEQITVSDVPVVRSFLACVCACTLILGCFLVAPSTFKTGWQRLMGVAEYSVEASSDGGSLRLSSMEVTYFYPAYVDQSPRHVQNDDGDLRAPAGTRVRLNATLEPSPETVQLVVNGGKGQTAEPDDDGDFRIEFTLLEEGQYRLESRSSTPRSTGDYDISIVGDEKPEVRISRLSPNADQGKSLELQEGDVVRIHYKASDDFGLGEVFFEYRQNGHVERKTIRSFSDNRSHVSGRYEWAVPSLTSTDGGELSFRIGVEDTDNINGPKIAYSRSFVVQTVTEELRHARQLEQQEKLLRRMVTLLGTQLTLAEQDNRTTARNKLRREISQVVELNRRVVEGMRDDPLADGAMYDEVVDMLDRRKREAGKFRDGSARGTVEETEWDSILSNVDWSIPRLENDVLTLDDLLQMDHMRSVKRMAERMKEMQESLREMLETMNDQVLDEKELKQLKDKIAAMQRMMRRLQQRMARTARQLEQGFFNPDALKKVENDNALSSALNELAERAQNGDMEGVLSDAKRLEGEINDMMSSLENAGKRLGRERMGAKMEEMRELRQNLGEMYRAQSGIKEDTVALQREMQQDVEGQLGDHLDDFIERNRRRSEEIGQELQTLREKLGELPGLKKYRQLRGELSDLLDQLARSRQSGEQGIEVQEPEREKLEGIYQEMNEVPGADEAHRVRRDMPAAMKTSATLGKLLSEVDVKGAVDRAEELNNRLTNYDRVLRQGRIPGGILREMKGIVQKGETLQEELDDLRGKMREHMDRAMRDVTQSKIGGTQQEQSELAGKMKKLMQRWTETAKNAVGTTGKTASGHMEEAAREISKKKLKRAEAHQKGALEALQKAMGESGKAMQKMQQQMQGKRVAMPQRQGRSGDVSGEVRIPEPASSEAARDFRRNIERVLEAGLPDLYRELNQKYYEELVQ